MHISLVGVNHRTAPIAVREKAAISADGLSDSLSLLQSYVPQGIILSTCNRTEVYVTDSGGQRVEEAGLNFFKAHLNIPDADLLQYIYTYRDRAVVEHLFRVACGLDSQIIGEFEVLGQVGHALEVAEKARMVSLPLRHIFHSAIRTGRLVREETGLSKNALSVSSVAVELASRVLGDLQDCKILVIGAGEAGRLVARVAREKGASHIVVTSRSEERAAELAAVLGGIAVSLDRLEEELATTNAVVTCAGAPHWILDVRRVEEVMRSRPQLPLVIIDIAFPRDVEPAVEQIGNVFLYNIDDLTEISNSNRQQREGEIHRAMEIIATEVSKVTSWWRTFEVRPVVSALMQKAEDIRIKQLNKALRKLPPLSEEEHDSLEAMTRSLVTKILEEPICHLKSKAGSDRNYAEIVCELFQLDREKQG